LSAAPAHDIVPGFVGRSPSARSGYVQFLSAKFSFPRYIPTMTTERTAMARFPLIGAVVLLLGIYVVAPGLALFRLDRAVRQGDTTTVARLVDFPSVRRGLAQEVAGGVLGGSPAQAGDATGKAKVAGGLPPFGFSFVSGIAEHEMAPHLTPRGLIRLARAGGPDQDGTPPAGVKPAGIRLAGLWLEGPRSVLIRLRIAGQHEPIRLRLRLEHGAWELVRVWLPPALLRRAAADGGGAEGRHAAAPRINRTTDAGGRAPAH
jgi:hypothetical protein